MVDATVETALSEPTSEEERDRTWKLWEMSYSNLRGLTHHVPDRLFVREALARAVARPPEVIACIDDGLSFGETEVIELGIGGSGILFSHDLRRAFVANLRREHIRIREVTFHEDCGAAAWFVRQESQRLGMVIDAQREAERAAQLLMNEFGLPGRPRRIGFGLDSSYRMRRPPGFHPARVIILDGTGRFNPAELLLPPAFFLSVRYFPGDEEIRRELALAVSVAFGSDGFGARFTPAAPLLLFLIGDETTPTWNVAALADRIQPLLPDFNGRVLALPFPIQRP